jgi:uncharacterized repeat protein (TIGR01451 family)
MKKPTFLFNIICSTLFFCFCTLGYSQSVDLEITKTTENNILVYDENEAFWYSIQIANLNTVNDATNVVMQDVLPQGLSFESVWVSNPPGTYNPATGFWNIPSIAAGASDIFWLEVRVDNGTAAATIRNSATIVSLDQIDTNSNNNSDDVDIRVTGADLAVVKSVDKSFPGPEETVVYTVVITNNGPNRANNITLEDVLPSNLAYLSSDVSQGSSYNSITGRWFVNDLDSNDSATITISAKVGAGTLGQTINNTASIFSVDDDDSITANNASTATIFVLEADLSIVKTVSDVKPNEGDVITYTIDYTNNSLYDAQFVQIIDLLPSELTYLSDTSPGGGYDSTTGVFDFGTLPANTSGFFTIDAQVNPTTGSLLVNNVASINSAAFDPDMSNNTSSKELQVAGSDLSVSTTVNNENPAEGDTVVFTVTISNEGPDAASNVKVIDPIPSNLNSCVVVESQGSYIMADDQWTVGTLAIGQTEVMTISGTLIKSGTFINVALASSDQGDGVPENNSASVTVNSLISFEAGASIIDMGVAPQTVNNGLKPYGLVYELANNNDIPVYWSINPEKNWSNAAGSTVTASGKEDQVDIVVNGKEYKGGPFIISAAFMSQAQPIIDQYVSLYSGLTVDSNLPAFVAPIHDIIARFPNAVIDTQNGGLITSAFYNRASLYSGQFSSSYRVTSPSDLNNCDDMFALPHADPHNWSSAQQLHLKDWVAQGGYLWMACHAVSSMEGLVDIDGDGTLDMNFLSNNGMVLWDDHNNNATPPFDYSLEPGIFNDYVASDPLMQFVGTLDGALSGGSEEVYIVKPGGYRPSTVFPVRDLNHPQTQPGGTFAPGPAASVVYGRAFGDPSQGLVMYEASHTIAGGSTAENVASARIYGNYLLQGGLDRNPDIQETTPAIPNNICSGETVPFTFAVSGVAPPFTYEWSIDCPDGSFSNSTELATSFTAPIVTVETQCIVRFMVTDACGRENFIAKVITIQPLPIPVITPLDDVCVGEDTVYTTETNKTNYLWTVTGGTITAGGTSDDDTVTVKWSALGAGQLGVTYTDEFECTGGNTENINVISCVAPCMGTFTTVDVLCNGASTGEIDLDITGGLAPYTYVWSNGSSTEDVTGLPADTYSVTATDVLGCSVVINGITILEPSNPIEINISKENATTSLGCLDGEATATPSGGTPPYSYVWSASASGQTTQTATNLPQGLHTVTVTDANS